MARRSPAHKAMSAALLGSDRTPGERAALARRAPAAGFSPESPWPMPGDRDKKALSCMAVAASVAPPEVVAVFLDAGARLSPASPSRQPSACRICLLHEAVMPMKPS